MRAERKFRIAGCRADFFRALPSITIVAAVLGCGGKPSVQLLPVEGMVMLKGKPLTEGSVSFRADGTGADPMYSPTGAIDSAGRYKLYVRDAEGCPAGRYRVVVFANEPYRKVGGGNAGLPRTIIHRKYNDPQSTPLRLEVREQASAGDYDLKLE